VQNHVEKKPFLSFLDCTATLGLGFKNIMDGGNWKEMFAAACDGDLELVTYHVKNGVDINYAHPEFLSTPLVACILAKQEEIALYFLDRGANPNMYSEFDGLRPIQAANQVGLPEVCKRLIALGAVQPRVDDEAGGRSSGFIERIKLKLGWSK
jgi:uncharacterized protein